MTHACENSLREHHCRGPLFKVKHNRENKTYCFDSVKHFIRTGHEIDLVKNVPRSEILKKKDRRLKHLSFVREDEL